jgi:hypothetical protein
MTSHPIYAVLILLAVSGIGIGVYEWFVSHRPNRSLRAGTNLPPPGWHGGNVRKGSR